MICWLLVIVYSTRSKALPGNRFLQAVPRLLLGEIGGTASEFALPGRAWERVE